MDALNQDGQTSQGVQGNAAGGDYNPQLGGVELPVPVDPFIQRYLTDPYQLDAETINQILTGTIAVASLRHGLTHD